MFILSDGVRRSGAVAASPRGSSGSPAGLIVGWAGFLPPLAPLQLLLAVATPLALAWVWGA